MNEELFRCFHCFRMHSMGAEYCPRTGRTLPSAWKTRMPFRHQLALWRDRLSLMRVGRFFLLLLAAVLGVWTAWARPSSTVPVLPVVAGDAPRIDVVFLIDSTGSMADEIDVVKQRVVAMMDDLRKGQPRPHVRFGVVTFRDRGDEYVVRTHPLTEDTQTVHKFVTDLVADGGGDMPESVNEGLEAAIEQMQWTPASVGKATRMIFLIGDAGPHLDYQDGPSYTRLCEQARQLSIKIQVMGCSGITENGLDDFRQIASLGGGDFEYLTYRQKVATDDGSIRYTLIEGDKAYVTDAKDESWRDGAKGLAAGGRAATIDYEEARMTTNAPAAAPMENNLDRVLTESVKKEARGMGVTY